MKQQVSDWSQIKNDLVELTLRATDAEWDFFIMMLKKRANKNHDDFMYWVDIPRNEYPYGGYTRSYSIRYHKRIEEHLILCIGLVDTLL